MIKLATMVVIVAVSALALAACGPAAGDTTAGVTGSPWKLASYANAEGKTVDVLAGREVTALFAQDRVAGSGGCNRYTGTFTASGQKLTVQVGGTTMMYCPPEELMAQEAEYLAALGRAASYKVSDNQLQVSGEDGAVLLTYAALEAKPLAGTNWGLMTYNNGKGAVTSALAGTDITAVFGDGGNLSGSAGCNSYNANYEVDGLKISIGPAATTRMACAEPEGIMEQEAAYLAALQTAARYEITGDELVLLNGEGARAAEFVARPDAAALATEMLANAEYKTEWTPEGVVQLENGEYRAPAAPGSASEIVISMTEHVATGALTDQASGTTEPGAAVILTSSGGGSGTFYELHAMVIRNGQITDAAWTQLGDRVQINSVAIENGQIVVDMVTAGPDDPQCCPSQQVVQTYALQGEELVLTSE